MRTVRLVCGVVTALVGAAPSRRAQALPTVRPIGPIVGVSSTPLKSVASAIQVSNGRVYANDITARRLLLFDSTLEAATVVLDSAAETDRAYGNSPGTLLRFAGDSVLFIAPLLQSMLVLNPDAGIVRVIAAPTTVNPMVL